MDWYNGPSEGVVHRALDDLAHSLAQPLPNGISASRRLPFLHIRTPTTFRGVMETSTFNIERAVPELTRRKRVCLLSHPHPLSRVMRPRVGLLTPRMRTGPILNVSLSLPGSARLRRPRPLARSCTSCYLKLQVPRPRAICGRLALGLGALMSGSTDWRIETQGTIGWGVARSMFFGSRRLFNVC